MKFMGQLSFKDFEVNKEFNFGYVSVTEQEIIDFATFFDPLDFHTNKEAAKNSIFGRLVASGPHIFKVFHLTKWIPLFKDSVMAGLELKWRFLKPVFADMKVFGNAVITDIKPNLEKGHAIIKWHFNFTNEEGEVLQTIDMVVLHNMK
jgi:acyl dehydratase